MTNNSSDQQLLDLGKAVIEIEGNAVLALQSRINDSFVQACRLMLSCNGRIIVTGMGKSGHIASKIAATLASTGTPAFYVHPGEASHGDLGMITPSDVVLVLSNSGETNEVLTILPIIKRLDVPLIAMTGKPYSSLAKFASVHLDLSVEQEACPLGLAPTSSTTVALAMGDALAVSLLQSRGFTKDDFALAHPGGSLGKRLLMRVNDIMHTGLEIPLVYETDVISHALLEMTQKKLGMTAVINSVDQVVGIFTDGDLRRMLKQDFDLYNTPISDVMTTHCTVIHEDILAAEAIKIMEQKKINALIVINDDSKPIGAINMHDLIQSGIA